MSDYEKACVLDRAVIPALIMGALLSAAGFVWSFTVAPLVLGAAVTPELIGGQMVANQLLFSQKIFYFHMPVALCSFVALFFTAYYGVRYLMTKEDRFDVRAKTATEVALVFIVCTMATGVPWTRFEWGVWWSWEPRLTTYLILMLLVIGYFVLRSSLADERKSKAFSAVFGIIAFVDAPICLLITRMIPSSTHPVVFRTDGGLTPDMLVGLLLSMAGIALIAWALYRLRLRQQEDARRIASLKEQIEDQDSEGVSR